MVEEGVDGFARAIDEVEHAGGEAGFVDELEDLGEGDGDLLGRLDDEGVAAGDGVGEEPEGDHRGEVERADGGEDAQRGADGPLVDTSSSAVLEAVAHHEGGDAAGDLDVLDGAAHLAAGVIESLSVVLGDRAGDLIEVLLEELAEGEEIADTLDGWGAPPVGIGLLGGFY